MELGIETLILPIKSNCMFHSLTTPDNKQIPELHTQIVYLLSGVVVVLSILTLISQGNHRKVWLILSTQ